MLLRLPDISVVPVLVEASLIVPAFVILEPVNFNVPLFVIVPAFDNAVFTVIVLLASLVNILPEAIETVFCVIVPAFSKF